MNRVLVQGIWRHAGHRCEYCRIPHPHYRLPFQVDHIIVRQHGGATTLENLALACFHCNRFKGPNIAGLDPASGELVPLFHPRTDLWIEHFRFDGAWLLGLTPIGRVTIHVLAMNRLGPQDISFANDRRFLTTVSFMPRIGVTNNAFSNTISAASRRKPM